jgi:hypothetical protein
MDAHVLPVRFSLVSFEVPRADVVRFHMMSGNTWLKLLHASRYPIVKPKDVEEFFKSRSKKSLSSFH